MTINFSNPLAMLIIFIAVSALALIFIVYFLYKIIEKTLPKLYAKMNKIIFALIPLLLAVPLWLFAGYELYKTFYNIQIKNSLNIFIGIAVGLAATSMYEIAVQAVIKYIEKKLREQGIKL